jgi:hypothetical protein
MKRHLAAPALAMLIALPATAAETVDAVWKEQQVEFTFLGIDTAYSCDVMEARIEMLLLHVGAAEGVEASTAPCPGYDRPQQRLPIRATFRTLAPAAEGDANVVKAAWSEVVLGKKSPRSIVDGDCRLLEQFQKHILPAIEHKVIEGSVACSASRRSIAGRLKLNVLKPVEENAPGASERKVTP